MINSLEIYEDCGAKVARAIRDKDASRAKFEMNWFTRAKNLEDKTDLSEIEKAYRKGYADGI